MFLGPVSFFFNCGSHTPPCADPAHYLSRSCVARHTGRCSGVTGTSCPGWEQLQQPLPGTHVKQLLLLPLPRSLPRSSPAQSKGGDQRPLNTAATSLHIYNLPPLLSRKATFLRPYQRGRKNVCLYASLKKKKDACFYLCCCLQDFPTACQSFLTPPVYVC